MQNTLCIFNGQTFNHPLPTPTAESLNSQTLNPKCQKASSPDTKKRISLNPATLMPPSETQNLKVPLPTQAPVEQWRSSTTAWLAVREPTRSTVIRLEYPVTYHRKCIYIYIYIYVCSSLSLHTLNKESNPYMYIA